MKDRIKELIKKEKMIVDGDRIILALSGGADSVYLFYLLLELKEETDFSFACVHLNHCLRGEEAKGDESFVKDLCKGFGIPLYLYRKDVASYAKKGKLTIEEAGRQLRYQVFKEAKADFGADKIALAHHADDLAETMLFNLARGSGIGGLCSLRAVRGDLIRPLLAVKKQEIEGDLLRRGIDFCKDSTNDSLEYSRNKIRKELLPRLKEVNSHCIEHMRESSAELLDIYRYLRAEAKKKYSCYCLLSEGERVIKKSLSNEDEVLQEQIILIYLEEILQGRRDIYRNHIEGIKKLLKSPAGKRISLPKSYAGISSYGEIVIKKEEKAEKEREEIAIDIQLPGEYRISGKNFNFEITYEREFQEKIYTKWLDYDKIQGVMQLRTRKPGDYLIINRWGGKKKLKDYFIDEKIAQEKRDRILLLAEGSKVIWVVGYRISEDCKIGQDTRRVLKIKADGGNICE